MLYSAAAIMNSTGYGHLDFAAFNASAFGLPSIPVDPRFSVDVQMHEATINEISVEMIGLNLMADLALRDWTSTLPGALSGTISGVLPMYIMGIPQAPLTEIPIRFLIWTLHIALYNFMVTDEFVESDFDPLYDNEIRGTLYFRDGPAPRSSALPLLLETGYSNKDMVLPPHLDSISAPGPKDDIGNIAIDVRPVSNSQALNQRDVFLILYATLKAVAFPSSSAISGQPFRVRLPPALDLKTQFTAQEGPDLPRRRPPYLRYGTIIEAIRLVPQWMLLDHGSFRELVFVIYTDRTTVGTGFVEKAERETWHLPPHILDANVSTS